MFGKAKLATLTRQVPADRVVTAVPKRSRRARRPKRAKEPRAPSVVRLLRKALEWRRQLDADEVRSQAEIARWEGLTRARVTQIMGLLRLSPAIREYILARPEVVCRPAVSGQTPRLIARIEEPQQQVDAFSKLRCSAFPRNEAPISRTIP